MAGWNLQQNSYYVMIEGKMYDCMGNTVKLYHCNTVDEAFLLFTSPVYDHDNFIEEVFHHFEWLTSEDMADLEDPDYAAPCFITFTLIKYNKPIFEDKKLDCDSKPEYGVWLSDYYTWYDGAECCGFRAAFEYLHAEFVAEYELSYESKHNSIIECNYSEVSTAVLKNRKQLRAEGLDESAIIRLINGQNALISENKEYFFERQEESF